jgi:hypothetical protein
MMKHLDKDLSIKPITPRINVISVIIALIGTISSFITIYLLVKDWKAIYLILGISLMALIILAILLINCWLMLKNTIDQHNKLCDKYNQLMKNHQELSVQFDVRSIQAEQFKQYRPMVIQLLKMALMHPSDTEQHQLTQLIVLLEGLEKNYNGVDHNG